MNELLTDFLTETGENLASLDRELIKLEQDPDTPGLISNIFRLVHTIKGTCGFLGLPRLERLAHSAENVLGRVRDGELLVTPPAVSAVLSAIDGIKFILTALEATEAEPPGDDEALIAVLNALASGDSAVSDAAPEEAATIEFETLTLPEPPVAEPTSPPPPAQPQAPVAEAAPRESSVALQSIRVHVHLLENLMTTVSELVLTRNQLLQIARNQKENDFAAPLQRLNQVVSELQEGVMKTRMQPIGNAWGMLPRIIRDLTQESNKRIELKMEGAETELDRQVLELIKDPLTHMIRNSADHGIEPPDERLRVGKPETGTIRLKAFHQGGHIIIEIGDDGRGLNLDRIKTKILTKGLASEAELAALTDNQICQFIFRPGFSTAEAITAVSGRGVGMDVVKTNVEKIGGTIELTSVAGMGSKFTIKIPLTLAIIAALIVDVAGERFAIPQTAVVELVRVGEGSANKQRIEQLNNAYVLRLRNQLLPLVTLQELFQLQPRSDRSAAADRFVVVVNFGGKSFGMIVDNVFDTEEIVVKPVAPVVRHVAVFSGNTILGDGSVIMILDPGGIAATLGGIVAGSTIEQEVVKAEVGENRRMKSMLVVQAGAGAPKAVPLSLVARLEEFDGEKIEWADGRPVIQYRGKLTALIPCDPGMMIASSGPQQALILADRDRVMALLVDSIVDIVETPVDLHFEGVSQGTFGSAIIAGKATDLLDVSYYIKMAFPDWFDAANDIEQAVQSHGRVLVVDDSAFFREMVSPLLSAEGYEVTTAATAADALGLCDRGEVFDAIISDLDMPGISGFDFATRVKHDARWGQTPLLALSASSSPATVERAMRSGFETHIAKFDKSVLLQELAHSVHPSKRAA